MRSKHEEVVPYNLQESLETCNLLKVVEDVFPLKDLVFVFSSKKNNLDVYGKLRYLEFVNR